MTTQKQRHTQGTYDQLNISGYQSAELEVRRSRGHVIYASLLSFLDVCWLQLVKEELAVLVCTCI